MSPRSDPLGKQLAIYEESWKTDHEEVKKSLWEFEDKLAVGLALFQAIHDRYWTWRDRVIRETEKFDLQEEQSFKERFVWWLRPCKRVMRRLDELETEYGAVEGGREFRRYFREARQILDAWTSPEPQAQEMEDEDELLEDIQAHSARTLSLEQTAKELDQVSRPAAQASVPLKHKPDYSKAF